MHGMSHDLRAISKKDIVPKFKRNEFLQFKVFS